MDVANDLVSGNDHRKHVFGIKFNCLINYALTYRLFPRFYLITQIGAIVCTLIERASCMFRLGLNAFWESPRKLAFVCGLAVVHKILHAE